MMHGREKSDLAIVAIKPANKACPRAGHRPDPWAGRPAAELVERRAGAEGNAEQQRTRRAQDRESVSQGLERIRQAARQRKKERFTSLDHHLSVAMLRTAYLALKRDAAPGVDGMTWEAYGTGLDRRIEHLHSRVQRGAYRAQPSRRRYIPKAELEAIYEVDFLGFSYGFRPKRGQHDALDALVVGITSTKVNFILDADIRSFFDEVSQPWLLRFLDHRVGDPRIHRLVQKWLRRGPGRRGTDGQRQGDRAGIGGITAAGQRLLALRLRPLGRTLATARGHRRHDHRAVRRRYRGRLRARGRRPALLGRDARAFGSVFADAASGENPPDRVWTPCGGTDAPSAGLANRRPSTSWALPSSAANPAGEISPSPEDPARPHAGEARGDQGRDASAAAPANPRPRGTAARCWRSAIMSLSCGCARCAAAARKMAAPGSGSHPWPAQRFAVKHPRWEPYA